MKYSKNEVLVYFKVQLSALVNIKDCCARKISVAIISAEEKSK